MSHHDAIGYEIDAECSNSIMERPVARIAVTFSIMERPVARIAELDLMRLDEHAAGRFDPLGVHPSAVIGENCRDG